MAELQSFFSKLYIDLQNRIKQEVPEIKWIEQDFGQDVYDKWRPNVAFPAVLIDFPDSDYSDMADDAQFGDVIISFRLLVAPFQQSYEGAPIEVVKGALEYFELEYKIVTTLNNWAPDYCQPLKRRKVQSNNRNDIGLRVRELRFATAYEEYEE